MTKGKFWISTSSPSTVAEPVQDRTKTDSLPPHSRVESGRCRWRPRKMQHPSFSGEKNIGMIQELQDAGVGDWDK